MTKSTKRNTFSVGAALALCAGSLGTSYAANDGSASISSLGEPTKTLAAHELSADDESITDVVRELLREAQHQDQFPQGPGPGEFPAPIFGGLDTAE